MHSVIEQMKFQFADWLSGKGKDSDIIISSRVRLARNLQNIPFVNRASEDQHNAVLSTVLSTAQKVAVFKNAKYFNMFALDELDKIFFVERRLISSEFAEMQSPRGFLVTDSEETSMMINEEDHIRIQVICSGFSLDKAWYSIRLIDEEMSKNLNYAFSDQFGYLTACPTNVGTGVRFSVFIHLPVLTFTKKIEGIFSEMIPAGIAVRGFYGEGSKVIGNFFQISNQYTLGWTEQGILDRVTPLIKRFIIQERKAREDIMNDQRIVIEDKIYRALGLISKARILSSIEFLDLLSALRLGVDLRLLKDYDTKLFNELIVLAQPAHIQKLEGKTLTEMERDILRASLVRKKLHLN